MDETINLRNFMNEMRVFLDSNHWQECHGPAAMNEIDRIEKFTSFSREYLEWSNKYFPSVTVTGALNHLMKEVTELAVSQSPDEAADCFMLLLFICNKMGWDLLEEAEKKLVINKSRQWEPINVEGWQHHKS